MNHVSAACITTHGLGPPSSTHKAKNCSVLTKLEAPLHLQFRKGNSIRYITVTYDTSTSSSTIIIRTIILQNMEKQADHQVFAAAPTTVFLFS